MKWHTARTLEMLRENLRLTREVRASALERGNLDLAAIEDETIARLEARIAQIEADAHRLASRPRAHPPAAG
jgi:hypothetical protein